MKAKTLDLKSFLSRHSQLSNKSDLFDETRDNIYDIRPSLYLKLNFQDSTKYSISLLKTFLKNFHKTFFFVIHIIKLLDYLSE